jgi:hypothetical protein
MPVSDAICRRIERKRQSKRAVLFLIDDRHERVAHFDAERID